MHRHQDEPGPEAAEPVEKRFAGRREASAVRRLVAERGGGGLVKKRHVSVACSCGMLTFMSMLDRQAIPGPLQYCSGNSRERHCVYRLVVVGDQTLRDKS